MAKPDHTASARPYVSPAKPTNPLGRPFWIEALAAESGQRVPATLVGIAMGLHALTRILANNEALRDTQVHSQRVEPGHWPLDAQTTEGLFAALYVLSERAEVLSQALLDVPGGDVNEPSRQV
ncbi:hypothetical protein [Dyella koreensis]|uniref:Uncharacterized protein n=1 Tax=Dyella koreensis TaxID=311235 RepID=A0ABW8K7X9_9GAMM